MENKSQLFSSSTKEKLCEWLRPPSFVMKIPLTKSPILEGKIRFIVPAASISLLDFQNPIEWSLGTSHVNLHAVSSVAGTEISIPSKIKNRFTDWIFDRIAAISNCEYMIDRMPKLTMMDITVFFNRALVGIVET